ncbi:hypothetical protein HG421_05920 [Xanthomonas campestris pv. badrii]|uniref:Uncharacterized protein n=1 Tax=Xanthomonas campestris pv. badrii TaxID=149696 RepID=A0A7Z2ZGN0_XANCA|nr:hypothetical protein [Xanthomonas campestris]QJD67303.1 hypothetical protein HG421_05920 [Xanthomonas campestris pv. badrii]
MRKWRWFVATELVEQGEQLGGFLLQQNQGTRVGLIHSTAPKTFPSVLVDQSKLHANMTMPVPQERSSSNGISMPCPA